MSGDSYVCYRRVLWNCNLELLGCIRFMIIMTFSRESPHQHLLWQVKLGQRARRTVVPLQTKSVSRLTSHLSEGGFLKQAFEYDQRGWRWLLRIKLVHRFHQHHGVTFTTVRHLFDRTCFSADYESVSPVSRTDLGERNHMQSPRATFNSGTLSSTRLCYN